MVKKRRLVYLCECGGEISKKIDFNKVAKAISAEVEKVVTVPMLCIPEVLNSLPEEISGFTHVVFGACTPKRIESTLREVAKKAKINPFLTHVVNLREQCAWVSKNPDLATDKAIHLMKGALNRVEYHEPLEEKYLDVNPDIAIVGAGVAGILAALTLSEDTRRTIYLIEKNPHIGGRTITYELLTPNLTCAQCLMAPLIQEVLGRSNIEVLTNAEVLEAKGGLGNFLLKVSQKPRYVDVDKCVGCSACIDVCPVRVASDYEYGMKERGAIYFPYSGALPNVPVVDSENCLYTSGCRKCIESCAFDAINFEDEAKEISLKCGAVILAPGFSVYPARDDARIYTSPKFERVLAKDGPTGGKILLPDGQEPKSVAIIHCVGREELGYCSNICCSVALKYSHMIHEQLPDCEIHHIYVDLVLPSPLHWKLYNKISKVARFHRRLPGSRVSVSSANGEVIVEYTGEGGNQRLNVDMAVLMCGITPSPEVKKIAELFDLSLSEFGFLEVTDPIMSPIEVSSGVLAAGGVLGPCDVEESVQQATAAAGMILSKLRHGEKLLIEPTACTIDGKRCSGCKLCIAICPYKAISYDKERDVCVIDEAFCKGCGICASACPAGAIKARHYTTEQIFAEIEGITGCASQ